MWAQNNDRADSFSYTSLINKSYFLKKCFEDCGTSSFIYIIAKVNVHKEINYIYFVTKGKFYINDTNLKGLMLI